MVWLFAGLQVQEGKFPVLMAQKHPRALLPACLKRPVRLLKGLFRGIVFVADMGEDHDIQIIVCNIFKESSGLKIR